MSFQPVLSIVVAVYNGEKFLPHFFDSLIAQKLENWELIIVNDGSKDDSESVIRQYEDKFENIKVLAQENQGVSVARNTGMAVATGQYITFPDIDDEIDARMYGRLLEIALAGDLDVATCNGTYVYTNGDAPKAIFPPNKVPSTGVISGPQWLQIGLSSRKFLHVTWLNLYRLSLIREHNFTFEPRLHHQDIPWTTEMLLVAKRVQFINEQYYEYLIHNQSVSHSLTGDERSVRKINTYLKILDMLMDIYKRHPEEVKQAPACLWQVGKEGLGVVLALLAIKSPETQKQMVQLFFDKGYWDIVWKHATTLKLKWRLIRRYSKLKAIINK
ncbi:glycosyltransferase [Providencia alcalifaciens]|uniref:Glycosyltransferase n=2 Tax=Providencia alcalifaciens TaxID=126385 RepID=A0AAW9V756_9GAMM|nr:glycosyltransferase [Providencia alcalifaciens]EKT64469.1 putative glycosyl transferase [Providencia alcalifaciens Dmel2]ETT04466.1 glycosyltransferase, group 2 family protein [Providencia alcalifaciens F90-2004]EUC96812.1 glycosyltransferase, group 2 family protein [Providencia alcalifaciens PAL-2]EUD11780.1 glycosyltransferase, group 2 family protein [Providencia alcalifaciens 205/92]MTB31129.1 glycosyltransferase [Providencia alcalifaciens]